MKKLILMSLLFAGVSAHAQSNPAINAAPLVAEVRQDANTKVLRGGAQVRVKFLHEITTEDKASKVGDRPRMEVAENVTVDGVTVIPQGTPVTGELTAVRNKGM